jgi:hypothetical protein
MSVPSQCTSRRRRLGSSLQPAIMLLLVFGLAGVYVQLPPSRPAGTNPPEPDEWKECAKCGITVHRNQDGLYICPRCRKNLDAADANDYS